MLEVYRDYCCRFFLVFVLLGCFLPGLPDAYAGPQDPSHDREKENRPPDYLYETPQYGQAGDFVAYPKKESQPKAKEKEAPNPNRYEPFGAPILAGNVDVGFLFGASAGVAKFQKGYTPYRWQGSLSAATSIKKGFDSVVLPVNFGIVAFDIPGLAKGRLRLLPKVEFWRIINAGYYGYGNGSTADEPRPGSTPKEDYYRNQYGMMFVKGRLNARIGLVHKLYILTGASFRYAMPTVYEGSALEEDSFKDDVDGKPLISGTSDQAIVGLHLGLGFDSRDNAINPLRGMFHELVVSLSPGRPDEVHFPLFGSLTLKTRFYVPLAGEYLVLALRLRGDLFFGTAPFHQLDLGAIRGVPLRRYHGLIHLLGNVEFRSVFYRFSFNKLKFGLGAAAFVDGGRVWADYRTCSVLDGTGFGLKYGVGGGLRFLIGEQQLIRFDVAYSPDMVDLNSNIPVGIYVAFGQFF
jgi:hypothetical protein